MQRRHSSSSSRRVRSADSQLDQMVRGIGASSGRAIGAAGDLLRSVVAPAPASGIAANGDRRDVGVRSVRVSREDGRTARVRESETARRDGGFLASMPGGSGEVQRDGVAAEAAAADGGAAAEPAAARSSEAAAASGVPLAAPEESQFEIAPDGLLGNLVGGVGREMGLRSGIQPGAANLREVPANPFWSPERKAFERLHFGENILGEQGIRGAGSTEASPGHVELDPVALFRIRCIREAEEKFREGILKMTQEGSASSSFVAAMEGKVCSDDVPRPPPGPPPDSPPKVLSSDVVPPPPPPLPPVPPMPHFGKDPGSGDKGDVWSKGLVGENPSESLRTFDLPRLDEEATALEFGDWLSMVDSYMGDLSYSSGLWWNMVHKGVEDCYHEWLQLGPLERLRLKPQLESQTQLWPRTERRALSMLLQAIPEHVRNEVISARKLTTDQVLFRLFCTYQPGGASERTKLLQAISDCKCGETVKDVLNWVRTWRRYVGRARELGVTLPDALVLVGVLQQGSEFLSQRSPQVAYRLNMIRQQLGLDQQPNTRNVMTYSEHLQAEAEELVLTSGGSVEVMKPPKTFGKPGVKALNDGGGLEPPKTLSDGSKGLSKGGVAASAAGSGSTSNSGPGVCKFWGSDEGCKRGDRCKFSHCMLNPKDNRCFGCSAIGHTKRDCPHVKKKMARAKSNGASRRESEDLGGGGKGSDGKGTPKRPPGLPSESPPEDKSGEEQLDKMMKEATALMKSLRPSVRAIHVCKANSGELVTGLLDGGATNALRQGKPEELSSALEVEVELAAGSIRLFQCVETGTLLSSERVEPIVPLRGLVSLGYKIRWDDRGCLIYHPQRGRIRCWLRNGCPVVTESHALGLIADIEAHERFKRLGPKLAVGRLSNPGVGMVERKIS